MLPEEAIRKDLEKTARDIISRKTWPILDAALFLGYSRNHMDLLATQKGFHINKIGGKKHLYAIDILDLFQENNDVSFPELKRKWYKDYKIEPPSA